MAFHVTCGRCGRRVLSRIERIEVSDVTSLYEHAVSCDKRSPTDPPPERDRLGSILQSFDVSQDRS